ncbi:hypothetical protein L7F22_025594 [Adiantum nelumboides]|nr:hypothetical protein [Adiantum nelumboides]
MGPRRKQRKIKAGGHQWNREMQIYAERGSMHDGNDSQVLSAAQPSTDDNADEFQQDALSSSGRSTAAQARLRAIFYPKFENEKSDQEVRMNMIDVVQSGKGVLEVSLKHSGSLFMYTGDHGGAFSKNSYGNLYTAVGVFVLASTFQEAWGAEAPQKQKEFTEYLESSHLCVSMELVTAVLGDHGQRPKQDYVVVTAVADLKGKPRFYATPDLIAFCRQWRLPTNHVWLFSSRESAASFFTAYDVLYEEGTATAVSSILDDISDISVPATKSHTDVQGEILEGLVARVVSFESTERLQKVLEEFPLITCKDYNRSHLQKTLREICGPCMMSEKEQIKDLLQSVGPEMCSDWSDWTFEGNNTSFLPKFLKAIPVDHTTLKLQEVLKVLQDRKMHVCYPSRLKRYDAKEQKTYYRMTVHVLQDYVFRKYHIQMRQNPELWPLYRGFCVDVYLMHGDQKTDTVTALSNNVSEDLHIFQENSSELGNESNILMLKLKFLPYKIRTFLIRNGLSVLFQSGFLAYKRYYLRQMRNWGTSAEKQQQLDQLLTEWAQYITGQHKGKGIDSYTYLSEAEPFLEHFARRSLENKVLVGYTGSAAKVEDFANDVAVDVDVSKEGTLSVAKQTVDELQGKGMIIFFPGIPGCGKSTLCKALLNDPGDLAYGRTIHSLMGDLVRGRYWHFLAKDRGKKSVTTITLADKNAPNVEVWRTVGDLCQSTSAIGVPVVPDSAGAEMNPFSLDELALFLYRVLQRANHPGHLDNKSHNAGYVLLMFYDLYAGKDRKAFEDTLKGQFGYLVKFPVLKANRPRLPFTIEEVLSEGLDLFKCHAERHGKLDSTKGTLAQQWSIWERRLREVLVRNAAYFEDVQVSFEEVFQTLRKQLVAIVRGDITMDTSTDGEERTSRSITFAALSLPAQEITNCLQQLTATNKEVGKYFQGRRVILKLAHVTLAHKYAHGIAAVAAFGGVRGAPMLVKLTALLFSSKVCALEVQIVENEKAVGSRNEWPHVTVWTAPGTKPKEANCLPELLKQGHATRIDFTPVEMLGTIELL